MAATPRSGRRPPPGDPLAQLRAVLRRQRGSASGTWFQNLAGSILVFRLTHSAFLLGVLNFCQFVPVLLLSPWAGASPTGSTAS